MSTNNAAYDWQRDDPVADLERAAEDLERARERVAEFGEDDLQQLADAYETFRDLLDRNQEAVVGDGDFQQFIAFQGDVEEAVEGLPEDLLLREAFEEADEHLQQRRLTESDFETVRADLEPVADLVARLEERRDAAERYRRARSAVRRKRHDLEERIDDLDRLRRLGDADLDAPTERLRDPIETYDEAVREAFVEFRREAPAREVVSLVEDTAAFPLVDFERPPADLADFLREGEAGDLSVPDLVEYAGYSRSKLDHYVADPDRFAHAVGSHTAYLRRLDAEPLTIGWPPPGAAALRYRCRELSSVVNRFAPAVVEDLRRVKRLPWTTDYDALRDSALAKAELTPEERERLRDGRVAAEREAAQAERDRLATALAEYPGP